MWQTYISANDDINIVKLLSDSVDFYLMFKDNNELELGSNPQGFKTDIFLLGTFSCAALKLQRYPTQILLIQLSMNMPTRILIHDSVISSVESYSVICSCNDGFKIAAGHVDNMLIV